MPNDGRQAQPGIEVVWRQGGGGCEVGGQAKTSVGCKETVVVDQRRAGSVAKLVGSCASTATATATGTCSLTAITVSSSTRYSAPATARQRAQRPSGTTSSAPWRRHSEQGHCSRTLQRYTPGTGKKRPPLLRSLGDNEFWLLLRQNQGLKESIMQCSHKYVNYVSQRIGFRSLLSTRLRFEISLTLCALYIIYYCCCCCCCC